MLDEKYMNLLEKYKQTKVSMAQDLKFAQRKVRRMANMLFEREKRSGVETTWRRNLFLCIMKLTESIYGGMDVGILDLEECGLGDGDAEKLAGVTGAAAARRKQAKEDIIEECRRKTVTDKGAMKMAQGLLKGGNSAVPALCINAARNYIGNAGARVLAGALVDNTFVQELDLRCNTIGKEGTMCMLDALRYKRACCSSRHERECCHGSGFRGVFRC